MRFILGGNANGKYERVLQLGFTREDIFDCRKQGYAQAFQFPVLYKLNGMVKQLLESGVEPVAYITEALKQAKVRVIVCDEVGAGVVPAEPALRHYREAVGRVSSVIAQNASVVERVYCGIATVLKNNEA